MEQDNKIPFLEILESDFSLCKECCMECEVEGCPLREKE